MNTQKYYLIQIQEFVDTSSPSAKALFEYPSRDEALAAFYGVLSSSMADTSIRSVLCEIMNGFGDVNHREYWERQGV